MITIRSTLLLIVLSSLSAPALAIYKCEAAGKVVYSDMPCLASGKMKEIAIAPPLSEPSVAQRQLDDDKKELRRLETSRQKDEAAAEKERRHAFKAHEAKQKKCKDLALRTKYADEDAANANWKTAEKAKRNARRATEKYQLSCHQ